MRGCRSGAAGSCTAEQPERSRRGVRRQRRRRNCCRCTGCTPKATSGPGAIRGIAGDRSRALWANADAATFYARALEAAGRLRTLPRREVLAVAEALGDACELTASYDRSLPGVCPSPAAC